MKTTLHMSLRGVSQKGYYCTLQLRITFITLRGLMAVPAADSNVLTKTAVNKCSNFITYRNSQYQTYCTSKSMYITSPSPTHTHKHTHTYNTHTHTHTHTHTLGSVLAVWMTSSNKSCSPCSNMIKTASFIPCLQQAHTRTHTQSHTITLSRKPYTYQKHRQKTYPCTGFLSGNA